MELFVRLWTFKLGHILPRMFIFSFHSISLLVRAYLAPVRPIQPDQSVSAKKTGEGRRHSRAFSRAGIITTLIIRSDANFSFSLDDGRAYRNTFHRQYLEGLDSTVQLLVSLVG